MEQSRTQHQPLDALDFEGLQLAFDEAKTLCDADVLYSIMAIARSRDGWDDTDPAYYYLAEACDAAVIEIQADQSKEITNGAN